jgi:phosphonate transport system permease protein
VSRPPTWWRVPHARTALVLLAVGWAVLKAVTGGGAGPNPDGFAALRRFLAAAVEPRLDPHFLALVGRSTITTLEYAVVGTALSVVLGLAGALPASRAWWSGRAERRPGRAGAWLAARVVLACPRGVHEVVWGLVLLGILGLDPLVAVLAIGLPFGAVCAKVFAEILDETSPAPFEALRAAGAGGATAALYGLLPSAAPDMLSYAAYRFECAVRSAAVLGMVGAGGLGFQLALSFEALHYREMWTLLFALALLCGTADGCGAWLRHRHRSPLRWLAAATVLAACCVLHLGLDVSGLTDPVTWQLTGDLLRAAWPPLADWGHVLSLALDTLAMSVLATALAFAGALVLALPAVRGRGHRPAGSPPRRLLRRLTGAGVRLVLLGLRAVPPPVWALLVLFVWFPGTVAGAIALACYNLGVLGRLLAEALEHADHATQRALTTLGASRPQVFLYAALPAVWRRFVALGMYRWEVVIRETVVVGVVGAGGLGRLLDEQTAGFDYAGMTATLLALVGLTLLVDLVGAALRSPGA